MNIDTVYVFNKLIKNKIQPYARPISTHDSVVFIPEIKANSMFDY